MPIYFGNAAAGAPFMFDSVGNHWSQNDTRRPNGHPHFHYLQTENGSGSIQIQGKTYTLNQNEGVLITPFIPHAYSRSTAAWYTLFATFTGLLENDIAKILGSKQVIFVDKKTGIQIADLISEIVRKYEQPSPDIKELSSDCYDLLLNFTDCAASRNMHLEPLYIRYIAPIVKEIETNYSEELTIQELSQSIYITPQYLSRLFRRYLGCSVYEYLTMYRINKAKELLLTSPHLKVLDIAIAVGFSDTSHFIAMFKKTTGLTPLEFRKMY